jgi:hypothetical protein
MRYVELHILPILLFCAPATVVLCRYPVPRTWLYVVLSAVLFPQGIVLTRYFEGWRWDERNRAGAYLLVNELLIVAVTGAAASLGRALQYH